MTWGASARGASPVRHSPVGVRPCGPVSRFPRPSGPGWVHAHPGSGWGHVRPGPCWGHVRPGLGGSQVRPGWAVPRSVRAGRFLFLRGPGGVPRARPNEPASAGGPPRVHPPASPRRWGREVDDPAAAHCHRSAASPQPAGCAAARPPCVPPGEQNAAHRSAPRKRRALKRPGSTKAGHAHTAHRRDALAPPAPAGPAPLTIGTPWLRLPRPGSHRGKRLAVVARCTAGATRHSGPGQTVTALKPCRRVAGELTTPDHPPRPLPPAPRLASSTIPV